MQFQPAPVVNTPKGSETCSFEKLTDFDAN